jgi:hypothetical protein
MNEDDDETGDSSVKKIELVEKIDNMYFAFMTIQIDGKI